MAIEKQNLTQQSNYSIIFKDKPPPGKHKRVWNKPTSNQMCGIITDINNIENNNNITTRDIIISCRETNKLRRIYETHNMYDPLHYVLLFPYGTFGWNII